MGSQTNLDSPSVERYDQFKTMPLTTENGGQYIPPDYNTGGRGS
jgi:hypothetical protein